MQTETALSMLSALAQEARLAIFRLLIEQGPEGLSVGVIRDRLGLANATLSFHLKELTQAGLIQRRPAGRHIYYAPDIDTMNALIDYLTENCCRSQASTCSTSGHSRHCEALRS